MRKSQASFVAGLDFVIEHYPLVAVTGWAALAFALFVSNDVSDEAGARSVLNGLRIAAGVTLSFFLLGAIYIWKRGQAIEDATTYRYALNFLDEDPTVDPAITWPESDEQEREFLSWHCRSLNALAQQGAWIAADNYLQSIADRFPPGSVKSKLYFHLSDYLVQLRFRSRQKRPLDVLIRSWLDDAPNVPSPISAWQCAYLFKTHRELMFSPTDKNNQSIFFSLPQRDQERICQHLLAGDAQTVKTLLLLSLGRKTLNSVDFFERGLDALMQLNPVTDDGKQSVAQVALIVIARLLSYDNYTLSPKAAAYLCHLYGDGENVLFSLTKFNKDFPGVDDGRLLSLARYLLSQALLFTQKAAVPSIAEGTTTVAYFYPNLMRNHVDDSNELSRISVVISDQTDLNQKCTVLMGVEGEVDSFPVVLLSADLQEGSKGFEAKGAVFYYQLFSYFICQVMQDEYSIGDHDGLRGRVIARFLRALSELSLKDEGIAHVQDRERAARNLAYFFCRSLCDSDAGPDVVSRYVIDLLAAWNQPLLQGAVQSNFYDQGAFSVMLPRLLNSLVLARSDDATTLLFQLLFDLHQEEHQVLVKNFLGRSRGIVEIFAKFNGHQFHRFLEKMKADIRASHIEPAFYCLVNCLWGLHIVQRPRLAWQLIDVLQLALVNKYPGHSINSLCAVFDFSGFAEIASREPLQLKSYDARFQIMNPMLMHLLTLVDEDSQNLFINFIDSCRDEDVKHHLVIFKPVLPINNQNALERFASWIGQKCANRVVAMLIFALHSPEYFASHRRSPGFYQEPPLLVAEVQTILCSFNKPTNLNHNSNREIIDYLLHFEFNKAKLEQLKEATNSLYLNIPTTESFGY